MSAPVQHVVLLPCPFCGAEATIAKGIREDYSGACTILSCRAEGPVASTQEEAAGKWNERTMLPDDVAMIFHIAKKLSIVLGLNEEEREWLVPIMEQWEPAED